MFTSFLSVILCQDTHSRVSKNKKGQALCQQLDWSNAEQKCFNIQEPFFTYQQEVCSLWELTIKQWLPL